MARALLAAALLAAALPRAAAGGAAAAPGWHPHAHGHHGGGPGSLHSTLGCGVAHAGPWERRVCFEAFTPSPGALEAAAEAGFLNVTLHFEVRVRPAGALPDAPWAPACGDTLRVRLWSRVALAAPRAALPARDPGHCGRYALHALLPPPGAQRAAYRADVRVVHVDGEGEADPPAPRLAPVNLVAFKDGPEVWNLQARVPGALHVPARGGGAAERPRRAEGFEAADTAWLRDSQMRGNETKLCAQRECKRLPRCRGGDAPGAWRVHNSMYGDYPGDPFRWRPFGCLYDRVSGPELRTCLDGFNVSKVYMLGESTLEQATDLMRMHAGVGGYYWPAALTEPNVRARWPNAALVGESYHGASTLLERGIDRLRDVARQAAAPGGVPPGAYVILQGANDAARDTLPAGAARVEAFLTQLRDGIANGTFAKPARGVIWATAPVRQYTAGAGPGQVECRWGANTSEARDLCVMSYPGDMLRNFEGGTAWQMHHGDQAYRTHGTLSRRAAFNQHAVATFRRLFPDGHVIDYEALTAALPSDYSYDGEHWVAVWDVWRHRVGRGVYEGKSMGGAELANVLANILCGPQ